MSHTQHRRGFWRSQDASAEVEYLLTMALVIVPLCLVMPGPIIAYNAMFFERLDLWINLPFP